MNVGMRIGLLFFVVMGQCSLIYAQGERATIRSGNKAYTEKDYNLAEYKYKKAAGKAPNNPVAVFNLGDALYSQNRFKDAGDQFEIASAMKGNNFPSSNAYHNLGNAYLKQALSQQNPDNKSQLIQKSIDNYKEALRRNPTDLDTKYNLAYAQSLQNKQQGGGNQPNKNQQDPKQDPQQKDQSQEESEKQPPQNPQPSQKKPQDLSKQQIDQMLNALQVQEDQLQRKIQKQKFKAQKTTIEKDW